MQNKKQKNGREKFKGFDIEAVSERWFEKLLKLVRDIWFLIFVWAPDLDIGIEDNWDAF